MSAPLREVKKETTPFLIALPRELNLWLREQKPKNLSLRRYIVVLLTKLRAAR